LARRYEPVDCRDKSETSVLTLQAARRHNFAHLSSFIQGLKMRSKRIVPAMAACVLAVATSSGLGAESIGPQNRAEATKIVAEMRRIVTPEGIERLEKVRIGGIDQWISIRGLDRRNPVFLYVHGGPGFPAMPTSWYYQRGWEEYFTVVQWDQRGAGKTYATNDPAQIAPTMTPERMVADTEELISWLRKELGKEKIFLLGHSWGSYLGLQVALRHPEWLHAYIPMGQITDEKESERRGWRFAMNRARQDKNEQAIRDLESIAPYATGDKAVPLKDLYLQRKWLRHYGGAVRGRRAYDHEDIGKNLAPEYTDADLQKIWDGNSFSEKYILSYLTTLNFSNVTALKCPVVMFNGRDDYNVSQSAAAEWFERLNAPSKQLVWFERSAHDIVNEEPGKVLLSLVQVVRPIAERAGDVAP
jgi:proline iminopeptidase